MAKGDKAATNSVRVGVRIRPANPKEVEAKMQASFAPTPDGLSVQEISDDGEGKKWHYDHVFGDDCNNEYVFNTLAKPLVASALDGYNTVLFMYGQTSSGKTFTLFGAPGIRGLVDHSLEEVYSGVHAAEEQEFVIRMLFVELYNEELRDLLHDDKESKPLKLGIVDDPVLGPLIHNITEKPFTTVADMRRHLDEGDKRRQFGYTDMNAHSSRSHVMVRLNIESRKVASKSKTPFRMNWGKDKPNCYSTLNLVDLAGSERANKSGTSGQALKEGSFINKSLLTLGTVISNLSEGKSAKHIPYRDSKLTRLLSSALGGNAMTCMITCISPASGNIQESHSTLRFASRAKRIVNNASKNELDDANSLRLKLGKQSDEIAELRAKLEGGVFEGADELKDKAARARKNFQSLKFLVTSSSSVIKALNKSSKFDLARRVREDVKGVLEGTKTLDDVMESHKDLMDKHLATDEKLTEKTRRFDRQLTRAIEDDEEDEENFSQTSEISVDIVDTFDNEELIEENSRIHLYAEDLLVRYTVDMGKLKDSKVDLQATLKAVNDELAKMTEKYTVSQEEVMKKDTENSELQKKLKKTIEKSSKDASCIQEQLADFENQLKEMDSIIRERDILIDQNQKDSDKQHEEIAKLKHANDQLTKELKEAVRMRQNFEDEAKRSKIELRGQVERLRNNMSNMLSQGDQESKVLENQNQFLFNDLRQAQDEKDALQNAKSRLTQELSYLTEELTKSQEYNKSLLKDFQQIRDQTSHDVDKVRLQALELDKKNAKLKVMQKEFDELKEQMADEYETQSKEIERLTTTAKAEQGVLAKKILELNSDISGLLKVEERANELEASLRTTEQQKQRALQDVKKLEKDIIDQNKKLEQQRRHADTASAESKQKLLDQRNENKKLKNRIQELEQTIESVETFISNEVNGGNGYDDDDSYQDQDDDHYIGDDSTYRSNSFDDGDIYNDESSHGGYSHRESWQSTRSTSPTTAAIINSSSSSSVGSYNNTRSRNNSTSQAMKKNSVSQPYTDTASRLSTIFPPERSTKAKALMLAVKTVTASFQCISMEQLQFITNAQRELLQGRDKYQSLVHDHLRISQEIETLNHLRHRSSESLDVCYQKEEGLNAQLLEMSKQLRENEVMLRSAKSTEECAVLKLQQVEFERDSLKSHYDNSKLLIKNLESEHKTLETLYHEIENTLKEKIEENLMLNLELDSYDQKLKIVESERDELTSQFIRGTGRRLDDIGRDTLYSRRTNGPTGNPVNSPPASPEGTPYRSPYSSPFKSSYSSYNY